MTAALSKSQLKLETRLETFDETDRELKRRLWLFYVLYDGDVRKELVTIELSDGQAYDREAMRRGSGERLRFWFRYIAVDTDRSPVDVKREWPLIELIVFSSVTVRVTRHRDNLDKYQAVGFRDTGPDVKLREAVLSPVRPKITLRRVHNLRQIPRQGAPSNLPASLAAYSFYAAGRDRAQYTNRGSVTELAARSEFERDDDPLMAKHSWTRVSFDARYQELRFVESGYRLRIYDQHYDLLDGRVVVHDDDNEEIDLLTAASRAVDEVRAYFDEGYQAERTWSDRTIRLSESFDEYDTALRMISLPKWVDYRLGFDTTSVMTETPTYLVQPQKQSYHAYTIDHRTTLDLQVSRYVFLFGAFARSRAADAANEQFATLLPGYRPGTRPSRYTDYIPWIQLEREGRNEPIKDFEKNQLPFYKFEKSVDQQMVEMEATILIGFTPVLGKAYDVYEAYLATTEGRDAFGNTVSDFQKLLTVLAVLLPFGGSVIRRAAAPALSSVARLCRSEIAVIRRALASGK